MPLMIFSYVLIRYRSTQGWSMSVSKKNIQVRITFHLQTSQQPLILSSSFTWYTVEVFLWAIRTLCLNILFCHTDHPWWQCNFHVSVYPIRGDTILTCYYNFWIVSTDISYKFSSFVLLLTSLVLMTAILILSLQAGSALLACELGVRSVLIEKSKLILTRTAIATYRVMVCRA